MDQKLQNVIKPSLSSRVTFKNNNFYKVSNVIKFNRQIQKGAHLISLVETRTKCPKTKYINSITRNYAKFSSTNTGLMFNLTKHSVVISRNQTQVNIS